MGGWCPDGNKRNVAQMQLFYFNLTTLTVMFGEYSEK
jgi:hypothetical protein